MPKIKDNIIILAFLALLVTAALTAQSVKSAAEAASTGAEPLSGGTETAAYNSGAGADELTRGGIFASDPEDEIQTGSDALFGIVPDSGASSEQQGTSEDGVCVPILMYHSVYDSAKSAGKYVVLPSELESDLKWLAEHGYEAVFISDLAEYTKGGTLPEKPVVITFDDGYYNNLVYAYPLLEKYGMKAVISVVGAYTDLYTTEHDRNIYYSCLSYEDVKLLALSGRFEIGNHSYDMHRQTKRRGAMRMSGESADAYRSVLLSDMTELQTKLEENSGIRPVVYTYPYGQVSPESQQVVKDAGFLSSLTCYEKPNYITRDPECLFMLNRWNRPSGETTAHFMKRAGLS